MERIAENISVMYQHLEDAAHRKAIFSHYMKMDESNLYPILGRFNATSIAIKRLHKFERGYEECLYGLELCLFLDAEISNIVNDPNLY